MEHDEHSIALSTGSMFHVTGMQHSLNSIIFVGEHLLLCAMEPRECWIIN